MKVELNYKKLLGYRILSAEEVSQRSEAAKINAKIGSKAGIKTL